VGRYRVEVRRGLWDAFQASPAYAFAGFLHALLLVALSFWTIAVHLQEERRAVEVTLAPKKEVVPVTAGVDKEAEALDALLDASEVDLNTASEVDTNDAFNEARGVAAGEVNVFGTGGGGQTGFGRGGSQNKRGGASKASRGSLEGGLEWLVRHRTKEGVWGSVGRHQPGRITARPSVARTGLALLCFLAAGYGPDDSSHRYHEVVLQARDWLIRRVGRSGKFDTPVGRAGQWYHCYEQAMGTLALAECLALQKEPNLSKAVKRAVRCIEKTQNRGAGWRYGNGDTDTSVTSWMILALKSAEHAGVPISTKAYDGVRRYLDGVTSPTGTTGYSTRSNPNPAMTATGLFLRITLGEQPTTTPNRKAARLVGRTRLAIKQGTIHNLYGVYYSALAMYQVGGKQWRAFNPHIRDGLISAQRRGKGCERGSWRGSGHIGDLTLATCFATLTLETYYRYMPVHAGSGDDPEAAPELEEEEEDPLSPGESQLEVATVAMLDARNDGDGGALLAAEAAYARSLRTLEGEQAAWALRGEARARLVEVAWLSKDERLMRQRIDQYLEAVPAGETPDGAVLRLRRLDRYRSTMKSAQEAFGPQGSEAARAQASEDLAALVALLRADQAGLTAGTDEAQECARLLAQAEDTETQAAFAVDPDQAIEANLAQLRAGGLTTKVEAPERRVLAALLLRAQRGFAAAAEAGDRAAFARAESDRDAYSSRKPDLRLEIADFRRLTPLRDRTELARAAALIALDRHREAADAAHALGLRDQADGPRRAQAEIVERRALAHLVRAGSGTQADKDRLVVLVERWTRGRPQLPPAEAVALGDLLLAAGREDAAATHYLSCLTQGAPREVENLARVGLAKVARARGDHAAALEHLDAVRVLDEGAERLDVTLERCRILRDQGKSEEALGDYLLALRSLSRTAKDQADAWWTVAELVGHTYVEAERHEDARRFLEEVRQQDRTFGASPERRARFISLMRQLDAMRGRERR
jgi:hypothetical protein